MEALSPVRLLPLFFWQGSNDDAHEGEPDAEGLSQREAFPEDGKGEDKGEYGDEVAEEGDDARFKMLEREDVYKRQHQRRRKAEGPVTGSRQA